MRNKVTILMLGVLLSCGGLAQAVPIAIQITGNVTSAGGSAIPSTIHVGDIFTGTYTYDSEAVNTSAYSSIGKYVFNSSYGISLSLDGLVFQTDPELSGFTIEVGDNVDFGNGTNDYYYVHSDQNVYTNGLWIGGISWNLSDNTHTAISSTALPITAPILGEWNYNYVFINGGDGGVGHVDFGIGGTVTQAIVIPEPLTGVLLMTGVLFLRRMR